MSSVELAASVISRELPDAYSVIEFGVGSHFHPSPTVLGDIRGVRNPHWTFDGARSYTACDNGTIGPDNGYLGTPQEYRDESQRRFAEFASGITTKRRGENIRLVFSSAQDLDVAPGNEVLAFNVLSSGITPEAIDSILARAKTLLVVGGLLVVRETFTPHLHPHGELVKRLDRIGFEQAEVVSPSNPLFEDLTAYYGPTVHDVEIASAGIRPKTNRYFCLALRPE